MAQQILYGLDVDAVLKQMSRKGMAEAVDGNGFSIRAFRRAFSNMFWAERMERWLPGI
jgi:hypothetical protein